MLFPTAPRLPGRAKFGIFCHKYSVPLITALFFGTSKLVPKKLPHLVPGLPFPAKICQWLPKHICIFLLDDATDVSVTKHLCMCVRYFKEDVPSFITNFLTLLPVTLCTASSLFSDIKSYFDAHNFPLSNIIGLGTDGASNLSGIHNSVYTKVREHSPHCVLVKCIRHSLNLCGKYAFAQLPSSLTVLLSDTAKWFKFSSIRRSDYDRLFHVMNTNIPNLHPSKFLSPSETRWLMTGKVINTVIIQWHELTAYFNCIKYTKNYSCKSLLEMLHDRPNYVYLVFASLLINEFKKINASFQHTNADHCYLYRDLNAFYISLRSRICRNELVRMYEKVENIHIRPITDIPFGARFYQELSETNFSNEQVLNIKHRGKNGRGLRHQFRRHWLFFPGLKMVLFIVEIIFSSGNHKKTWLFLILSWNLK